MTIHFLPGPSVEVPEIHFEDRICVPVQRTAMVILDMQNDFVKEGGTLVVPAASETLRHIQRLLRLARDHGVHVAYTQDTHLEGDEEWQIWPEHVRSETWGWEIVEELKPRPGDLICRKSRYDGLYGTWLEHYLAYVWHVEHVILVGTVSNICVLHTAGSLGLRHFHIVMPANGISALTDFDQAATLRQVSWLYKGAVVRDVDDIVFEG